MSGVNADKKLGLVQSTVSKSTSPTTIDIFMHATHSGTCLLPHLCTVFNRDASF